MSNKKIIKEKVCEHEIQSNPIYIIPIIATEYFNKNLQNYKMEVQKKKLKFWFKNNTDKSRINNFLEKDLTDLKQQILPFALSEDLTQGTIDDLVIEDQMIEKFFNNQHYPYTHTHLIKRLEEVALDQSIKDKIKQFHNQQMNDFYKNHSQNFVPLFVYYQSSSTEYSQQQFRTLVDSYLDKTHQKTFQLKSLSDNQDQILKGCVSNMNSQMNCTQNNSELSVEKQNISLQLKQSNPNDISKLIDNNSNHKQEENLKIQKDNEKTSVQDQTKIIQQNVNQDQQDNSDQQNLSDDDPEGGQLHKPVIKEKQKKNNLNTNKDNQNESENSSSMTKALLINDNFKTNIFGNTSSDQDNRKSQFNPKKDENKQKPLQKLKKNEYQAEQNNTLNTSSENRNNIQSLQFPQQIIEEVEEYPGVNKKKQQQRNQTDQRNNQEQKNHQNDKNDYQINNEKQNYQKKKYNQNVQYEKKQKNSLNSNFQENNFNIQKNQKVIYEKKYNNNNNNNNNINQNQDQNQKQLNINNIEGEQNNHQDSSDSNKSNTSQHSILQEKHDQSQDNLTELKSNLQASTATQSQASDYKQTSDEQDEGGNKKRKYLSTFQKLEGNQDQQQQNENRQQTNFNRASRGNRNILKQDEEQNQNNQYLDKKNGNSGVNREKNTQNEKGQNYNNVQDNVNVQYNSEENKQNGRKMDNKTNENDQQVSSQPSNTRGNRTRNGNTFKDNQLDNQNNNFNGRKSDNVNNKFQNNNDQNGKAEYAKQNNYQQQKQHLRRDQDRDDEQQNDFQDLKKNQDKNQEVPQVLNQRKTEREVRGQDSQTNNYCQNEQFSENNQQNNIIEEKQEDKAEEAPQKRKYKRKNQEEGQIQSQPSRTRGTRGNPQNDVDQDQNRTNRGQNQNCHDGDDNTSNQSQPNRQRGTRGNPQNDVDQDQNRTNRGQNQNGHDGDDNTSNQSQPNRQRGTRGNRQNDKGQDSNGTNKRQNQNSYDNDENSNNQSQPNRVRIGKQYPQNDVDKDQNETNERQNQNCHDDDEANNQSQPNRKRGDRGNLQNDVDQNQYTRNKRQNQNGYDLDDNANNCQQEQEEDIQMDQIVLDTLNLDNTLAGVNPKRVEKIKQNGKYSYDFHNYESYSYKNNQRKNEYQLNDYEKRKSSKTRNNSKNQRGEQRGEYNNKNQEGRQIGYSSNQNNKKLEKKQDDYQNEVQSQFQADSKSYQQNKDKDYDQSQMQLTIQQLMLVLTYMEDSRMSKISMLSIDENNEIIQIQFKDSDRNQLRAIQQIINTFNLFEIESKYWEKLKNVHLQYKNVYEHLVSQMKLKSQKLISKEILQNVHYSSENLKQQILKNKLFDSKSYFIGVKETNDIAQIQEDIKKFFKKVIKQFLQVQDQKEYKISNTDNDKLYEHLDNWNNKYNKYFIGLQYGDKHSKVIFSLHSCNQNQEIDNIKKEYAKFLERYFNAYGFIIQDYQMKEIAIGIKKQYISSNVSNLKISLFECCASSLPNEDINSLNDQQKYNFYQKIKSNKIKKDNQDINDSQQFDKKIVISIKCVKSEVQATVSEIQKFFQNIKPKQQPIQLNIESLKGINPPNDQKYQAMYLKHLEKIYKQDLKRFILYKKMNGISFDVQLLNNQSMNFNLLCCEEEKQQILEQLIGVIRQTSQRIKVKECKFQLKELLKFLQEGNNSFQSLKNDQKNQSNNSDDLNISNMSIGKNNPNFIDFLKKYNIGIFEKNQDQCYILGLESDCEASYMFLKMHLCPSYFYKKSYSKRFLNKDQIQGKLNFLVAKKLILPSYNNSDLPVQYRTYEIKVFEESFTFTYYSDHVSEFKKEFKEKLEKELKNIEKFSFTYELNKQSQYEKLKQTQVRDDLFERFGAIYILAEKYTQEKQNRKVIFKLLNKEKLIRCENYIQKHINQL
ncbi:hypothetical protein ABPG72_001212 [Tetrahymena utriculariae]